eukprot:596400-Amphidinium_carterae.1
MAISPQDRWATGLLVYNPALSKNQVFHMLALPLGAAGSVLQFNRTSKAIAAVGRSALLLPWAAYFDQVEFAETARSAEIAGEALMNLLGWTYSIAKLQSMATVFDSLGV